MNTLEIMLDLEKQIDALWEQARKKILPQIANGLVQELIEAPTEDVDAWLSALDPQARRDALGQLLHLINRAQAAGHIKIIFEQTDWDIDEDEDEDCARTSAEDDGVVSRSMVGHSEMFGEALVVWPKAAGAKKGSQRRHHRIVDGKERSISIELTP